MIENRNRTDLIIKNLQLIKDDMILNFDYLFDYLVKYNLHRLNYIIHLTLLFPVHFNYFNLLFT
jgi:hypothetical protein